MTDEVWTDEKIARLRNLWAEGYSTADIGRMMGMSKNSIVGKAHRLGLPPRPSPIIIAGLPRAPRPARPVRAGTSTLPVLVASAEIVTLLPPPPPKPIAPPRPAFVSPLAPCQWPVVECRRQHVMCGADAVPGKPYCLTHCRKAYVNVRDRGAAAA